MYRYRWAINDDAADDNRYHGEDTRDARSGINQSARRLTASGYTGDQYVLHHRSDSNQSTNICITMSVSFNFRFFMVQNQNQETH